MPRWVLCTCFTAGVLLGLADAAAAQVYVFVRTDHSDVTYSANQQNGRTKVQKAVAQKPGIWEPLVESTTEGYGSVFCVSEEGGGNPKYFYSLGKLTSKEAIIDARQQAREYAKGRKGVGAPDMMRIFHNTNRHPLEQKNTTFGIRG